MSTYPGDADGHDIDIDYEDCSDEPDEVSKTTQTEGNGQTTGADMTRDEFEAALMTTPFSNRELRLHDAEQRQVIEQQGQHIATLREALQAICSGISRDLLGTTSMDRETMQSIAQQAIKEVNL